MNEKRLSFVAGAIVVVVLVVAVIVLTTGMKRMTPLTPEMREGLGATAYVPGDVAVYTSSYRLADKWTRFLQSNALQSLVRTPYAQQLIMQVQMNPGFRGFMAQLSTNPDLVEVLPVLKDAVSTEVFVSVGREVAGTVEAVLCLLNSVRMAGFQSGLRRRPRSEGPDMNMVLEQVVTFQDNLRMPPILIGSKLTKPDAARALLDKWLPRVPATPIGSIETKTFHGARFYVFDFKASVLPAQVFQRLQIALLQEGIAPDVQKEFIAWVRSQRLVIAVGVLGDYLLLSLGRDTSLLESWGGGDSLAESVAFEPLRKRYRPGLDSLSYASAELFESMTTTKEDALAMWEMGLEMIEQAGPPSGLAEELEEDVTAFIDDIEFPVPTGQLAVTFDNQGVEGLSFGGPSASTDFSEPLAILAHRGKSPILCSAAHAGESADTYDVAVKWLKVAYGYVEKYVVPKLNPTQRAEYDKVAKFALPFLASVDSATRECLIPAADGTQSLFVLDGGGFLKALPGEQPFPRPIPLPRIALAWQLNDGQKFLEGMERYAAAIRKLIADARVAYPQLPPAIQLPPPKTETVAGGTLYYYTIPGDLGRDVFPCALLKGDLLILGTSAPHVGEMAQPCDMPACPVLALDEAAGSITLVNATKGWDYLARAGNAAFAIIMANKRMSPQERMQVMMVKTHADALWRALGAIRSYASVTTLEDDGVVSHSWLHVEDIGK